IELDQWVQVGNYSGHTINGMVEALLPKLTWPKDKQEIADLMYMYYALGRTIPYDRSYFSMQQMIMEKIRREVDPKSPEGAKLASAARYLEDQYQTVANSLYGYKRIQDPAKVNVVGINQLEE